MIFPNKFISFDSSVLSRLHIISEIDVKKISLVELYYELHNKFDSMDEFLYFIDVLYLLDYLEVDFEKEEVIIC
ncbi:hypothetical protein KKG81_14100 [bacterium]|nr:hypothetical protein [bacterium]